MNRIINADVIEGLKNLEPDSVDCVVTSPPYWGLRDYGVAGQIGLESTPEEYVARMVEVFAEVWRILKPTGTLWLNLGDSYCSTGESHDGRSDNQSGVGSKRIWRDGAGRADGVIDSRGQRNRNGNSVIGLKSKDLVGIPWRVAFALQAAGWYLRQDIIWSKPNPMPESVTDRCTKSHEYIFLLTKSSRYYYDHEIIREPAAKSSLARWDQDIENQDGSARVPGKTNGPMRAVGGPRSDKQRGHGRRHAGFSDRWDSMSKEEQAANGRNKRSVWNVATQPFSEAHFATFPPKLIEPCILAGCPPEGIVLDPFLGSGTVAQVAIENSRQYIGIELNPAYIEIAKRRIGGAEPQLFGIGTESESEEVFIFEKGAFHSA